MDVTVGHGLTSGGAAIDSDVERVNRTVGLLDGPTNLTDEPVNGSHFAIVQVEVVCDVPPRNHERMQRRDGVFVAHGDGDGMGLNFLRPDVGRVYILDAC